MALFILGFCLRNLMSPLISHKSGLHYSHHQHQASEMTAVMRIKPCCAAFWSRSMRFPAIRWCWASLEHHLSQKMSLVCMSEQLGLKKKSKQALWSCVYSNNIFKKKSRVLIYTYLSNDQQHNCISNRVITRMLDNTVNNQLISWLLLIFQKKDISMPSQ